MFFDTVLASVCRLETWLDRNGWAGFDPFDIMGTKWGIALQNSKTLPQKAARKILFKTISRFPMPMRKITNIRKEINAKGMGLLVSAYCRLYEALGEGRYLQEAIRRADWLLENSNKNYPGLSWGYPFDWQSVVFIPKFTPSSVVTTAVGDGLWRLGILTGKEKYSQACCKISEFLINGLHITEIDKNTLCFSYTPVDQYLVHNANLFSAEFLARIGMESGNQKWIDLGIKAGNFALMEILPNGSLYYWGKKQNNYSPNHRDCYHSGFEIRCLWGLWKSTKDVRFRDAALKYLDFFYHAYISDDGEVMTLPGKKYPLDIHSCAEAMLCPATMSEVDNSRFVEKIEGILNYTINLMQNKDGSFAYMAYSPTNIDRTPYLRWGQAWMLRGLAEVLFSLKNNQQLKKNNKDKV